MCHKTNFFYFCSVKKKKVPSLDVSINFEDISQVILIAAVGAILLIPRLKEATYDDKNIQSLWKTNLPVILLCCRLNVLHILCWNQTGFCLCDGRYDCLSGESLWLPKHKIDIKINPGTIKQTSCQYFQRCFLQQGPQILQRLFFCHYQVFFGKIMLIVTFLMFTPSCFILFNRSFLFRLWESWFHFALKYSFSGITAWRKGTMFDAMIFVLIINFQMIWPFL